MLARGAQAVGDRLAGSPFDVEDASVESQEAVRNFAGHLGIVAHLMDTNDLRKLRARATVTAYSMVDEDMVDADSVVELRTLAPAEALRSQEFVTSSLVSMGLIKRVLRDEYGISAIENSLPIMPTEKADSPVDDNQVWDAMAVELDGFRRQIRTESDQTPAMLAITAASYAKRVFRRQLHFDSQHLDDGRVMVMQSTGDEPRENLLLPPRATSPLEPEMSHAPILH